MFGPYGLRGVVDVLLASVTAVPVATGALAGYGVGTSTGAVTFNSLLQAEPPGRVRDRVFAATDVLWQGGRLLPWRSGAPWWTCRHPSRLLPRRRAPCGRRTGREPGRSHHVTATA